MRLRLACLYTKTQPQDSECVCTTGQRAHACVSCAMCRQSADHIKTRPGHRRPTARSSSKPAPSAETVQAAAALLRCRPAARGRRATPWHRRCGARARCACRAVRGERRGAQRERHCRRSEAGGARKAQRKLTPLIAATRRLNCKGEVKAEHTVKFVRASRSTSSGSLYCQGCFRWLDHARWVGHAASDGALHHQSRSRRAG